MKATLCALTLLTAVLVFAADPPPDKKKHSFSEVACAQDGPGLLVRYHARDAVDGAAFQNESGLSFFGPQPAPEPQGVVPKGGPKAPKPHTYRIAAGEGCEDSFAKLSLFGERGERLEVARGTDDPRKIESSFEKQSLSFSQAKEIQFDKASKSTLDNFFEKLRGQNAPLTDILASMEGVSVNPGADAAVMAAPPGKLNLAGHPVSEVQLQQRAPRIREVPAFEASEEAESRAEAPKTGLRGFVSGIADTVAGNYNSLKDKISCFRDPSCEAATPAPMAPDANVDQTINPYDTKNWKMLPSSGPGYKFARYGQWGTPKLVTGLMVSLASVNQGTPIEVGDLSYRNGGPIRGHASHQHGVDVDVFFPGGTEKPEDQRAAQFIVTAAEKMGATRIFLSDRRRQDFFRALPPEKQKDANVRRLFGMDGGRGTIHFWPGHDNHFHIRIKDLGGGG